MSRKRNDYHNQYIIIIIIHNAGNKHIVDVIGIYYNNVYIGVRCTSMGKKPRSCYSCL